MQESEAAPSHVCALTTSTRQSRRNHQDTTVHRIGNYGGPVSCHHHDSRAFGRRCRAQRHQFPSLSDVRDGQACCLASAHVEILLGIQVVDAVDASTSIQLRKHRPIVASVENLDFVGACDEEESPGLVVSQPTRAITPTTRVPSLHQLARFHVDDDGLVLVFEICEEPPARAIHGVALGFSRKREARNLL